MTNSEARKRAAEAQARAECPLSQPNSPEAGPNPSGWQIDPQAICQCGANGWHICPNPAPVDSGAIGRLNGAERAALVEGFLAWWVSLEASDYEDMIREAGQEDAEVYADAISPVVAALIREHTDRALAEVEQRIAAIPFSAAPSFNTGRNAALAIVRAARQERDLR